MNDNGVACFITPNGLLRSIAYQDTRNHILKTSQFIEIADLGSGAFGKNITVSPIVFLFRKALQNNLENFDIVEANFAKDKVIKRKKVQGMNQSTFLDIAMILGLIAFLSTVAFSYYLEKRNRKKREKQRRDD